MSATQPNFRDSCDFCQIVAGSSPAQIVAENPHTVAFFPLRPATPGHTLVVPRSHVEHIWDLTGQEAQAIAVEVVSLSKLIRRALAPAGLNVIQSNGAAATQTVPHVHFHLVPRERGDSMGAIWPERSVVTEEQRANAFTRMRRAKDLVD